MKRYLPGLIVALAALLVGVVGNGSHLPLDDHEVRVARTAEEMLARGSVIVPYLNDVPRTAKPPLAYWATMLVDVGEAGNRDGIISEWEARVPSIIGGMLWALATLALAASLCGRTVGFIAALLLIGSTGFHSYTHSARPELLYAMFCTAGLACFARQWQLLGGPGIALGHAPAATAAPRTEEATRPGETPGPPLTILWPALGWIMVGLAVLTKGPQLPLIMLAAWAIGTAAMGERRLILRTLRPISGIVIVAAVALWWFIIMWTGVEGAGDRMSRETIGRILQVEGKPLTRIIDPYYFYRITVLLVPWIVLYIAALASPWIREIKLPRGPRLLWWISVITIASLHLTLNRRWYYLLPMMAPLSVLMAWSALAIGEALLERGRVWMWRTIVLLHIAAGPIILIYLHQRKPPMLQPTVLTMGLLAGVAGIAAVMVLVRPRARESAERGLIIASIVSIALMVSAGVRATFWNVERYHRRDFALEVGRSVGGPPDSVLLGYHDNWQQEQYYLHREIPSFDRPVDLAAAIREAVRGGRSGRPVWVLTNSRKPLEAALRNVELTESIRRSVERDEDVTLWRAHLRPPQ